MTWLFKKRATRTNNRRMLQISLKTYTQQYCQGTIFIQGCDFCRERPGGRYLLRYLMQTIFVETYISNNFRWRTIFIQRCNYRRRYSPKTEDYTRFVTWVSFSMYRAPTFMGQTLQFWFGIASKVLHRYLLASVIFVTDIDALYSLNNWIMKKLLFHWSKIIIKLVRTLILVYYINVRSQKASMMMYTVYTYDAFSRKSFYVASVQKFGLFSR